MFKSWFSKENLVLIEFKSVFFVQGGLAAGFLYHLTSMGKILALIFGCFFAKKINKGSEKYLSVMIFNK